MRITSVISGGIYYDRAEGGHLPICGINGVDEMKGYVDRAI